MSKSSKLWVFRRACKNIKFVQNLLKLETSNANLSFFFLVMLSQAPSMQLECMANYLAELSLLEYSMLRYAPSLVAASAIFLARFILLPPMRPWVCLWQFKHHPVIISVSTKILYHSQPLDVIENCICLMQNSTLKHYAQYEPSDLLECVNALHSLACNSLNSNLPAIREKYSQHKVRNLPHALFTISMLISLYGSRISIYQKFSW